MNNLKVSFAKPLIFREEDQSMLIFNKNNSAVIKLSLSLFNQIRNGWISDEMRYSKALKILQDNKMVHIDSWNKVLPVSEAIRAEEQKALNASLFNIKSHQNPFVALWAITPKCNLKCTYCFPEVNKIGSTFSGLTIDQLKNIANQIVVAKIFQLTISGGEAFLVKELWELIPVLYENQIKISVISNGTTITPSLIEKILRYELIVGISLDAPNESINSITRGAGVFEKTWNGIKKLLSASVPTVVLVTLTKHNFPCLFDHIRFLYEQGIRNITLQDLRPFGTRAIYDQFRLTKEQESALYALIKTLKKTFPEINFNLSELFIFPCKEMQVKRNGKIMQCPAGNNFVYIDYYGDLYPCTNLPQIKLGNILKDGSITELWRCSPEMDQLRALKMQNISDIEACVNCSLVAYCDGGCRGDALFYTGNVYGRPSRCPKSMGVVDEL
ncbi:MAG: hypothetical protein A2103_04060 [Gammaproteobacteria bacterium GWF2_41_13]|nr:MAG: hypothetical protein A2103_04060 [Gammaproteobacteria bacterium GWF2_41_13]